MTVGNDELISKAIKAANDYKNSKRNEKQGINDMYGELVMASDGTISGITMEKLQQLMDNRIDEKTKTLSETVESQQEQITALQTTNTNLTMQINTLKSDMSIGNIKSYYAYNTNSFAAIDLDVGDYICIIANYGHGCISNKPAVYMISYGDNKDYGTTYKSKKFQLVTGASSFTITVTGRTSSNNKGRLNITCPSKAYWQCTLIKIDNGHG